MKSTDKEVVSNSRLETHNFLTKCVRVITVPLLNTIPESVIKKMMQKSSKDASAVMSSAGSTQALEVMYTRYQRRRLSKHILRNIADLFWHHVVSQPKALRNRLKIVRNILQEHIDVLAVKQDKKPIYVLSIAGGSSRALIQIVQDLQKKYTDLSIKVVTLDKDQAALDIGESIARDVGVSESFDWVCGKASDVQTLVPHTQFDVIEIVGLLDYFDNSRVRRLIETARGIINPRNGVLVAANVIPNSEVKFVRKSGWPKMIYRTPSEFESLFIQNGFSDVSTQAEPLKIHCIIAARNG